MNEPITVVIPCHNHKQWVNDAIDSVIAQDYPNKRIVVVDDGSTDGSTGAVINRFTDRQFSPIVQPSICMGKINGVDILSARFTEARGPSFARNYGIKVGWEQTEAFMFLDSDDKYMPGKISKSVAKWRDAPHHVGAVYSDFDTYSPTTQLTIRHYKEPFSRERLVQECLPNMDSLVSRFAFDQCGLFDEHMRTCEDYDLWMRIAEKFIIVHIPEPLLVLRVGEHSSSSTVPSAIWQQNWNRVMAKAKARMSNA